MTVKLILAEMRNQHGMTQEDLARKMDMTLGGIQYLEYKATGVKLDLLDQLCTVFACEPGDLLKRFQDDNKDQSQPSREEQRQKRSARMREWWAAKRDEKEQKEENAA